MKSNTATALMPNVATQATGCLGAGSYLQFAKEHGYNHLEVLNWSSSAGDWQFIVSKDGQEWHILWQENNYPRPGFTHRIDKDTVFFGDADLVLEWICEAW